MNAPERVAAYLNRRAKNRADGSDHIHGYDAGCESEAVLSADDLAELLARIAALEAELASGSFYQEKDIDALEARADRAEALLAEAVEALKDACSALDYIRYHYGDLHGVGFDRVRDKHDATLDRIKEVKDNG